MSSSAEAHTGARPAEVPDLRLVTLETDPVSGGSTATTRVRAQAEGYAAGYFKAVAEARALAASELAAMRVELAATATEAARRRQAEHAEALTALTRASEALAVRSEEVLLATAADAADLAALLVEAILGRELGRLDVETANADVVRRVVAALGDLAAEQAGTADPARATVRLSPAVAGTLDEGQVAQLAALGSRVVADPTLGRDDAVVDADATRVDLRLAGTLTRVTAALTGDDR